MADRVDSILDICELRKLLKEVFFRRSFSFPVQLSVEQHLQKKSFKKLQSKLRISSLLPLWKGFTHLGIAQIESSRRSILKAT